MWGEGERAYLRLPAPVRGVQGERPNPDLMGAFWGCDRIWKLGWRARS